MRVCLGCSWSSKEASVKAGVGCSVHHGGVGES